MLTALFFGSIGTLIETSELQRQAYNRAFRRAGLDWYWNVATYCQLLRQVGGKARLKRYADGQIDNATLDQVHRLKESYFKEMLAGGEDARPGVREIIHAAQQKGLLIYWVTTTSQSNIDGVLQALIGQLQRDDFDRIYTAQDVTAPKPDPAIYRQALMDSGYSPDQILVIEDTQENAEAARAAGLRTLLFSGEYALSDDSHSLHHLSAELLD